MKIWERLFIAPKDYKKVKENEVNNIENKNEGDDECIDYVTNYTFDPNFTVTIEEFEDKLSEAYANLPQDFKNKLENISIELIEEPMEPYKSKLPPNTELLGLYVGVDITRRHNGYGYANMPDTIFIFANPIRRCATSKEQCLDQVRKTLWHEVGHYFGLDDKRLRELGY